jgi:UDP-xylose/UDP-N-acetylglucosamine transporter B4
MAALFAVMSLLNNLAFAFHISQPMHMVFRSANLMVTYAFGRVFFGKRYSRDALVTILLLTAGAVCNTIAEATVGDTARKAKAGGGGGCTGVGCGNAAPLDVGGSAATAAAASSSAAYMFTWIMGVAILSAVLCLQSVLGEYQNWVGRTFASKAPLLPNGKPDRRETNAESMFYMHALSLPILASLLLVQAAPTRGGEDSSSTTEGGWVAPLPFTITFQPVLSALARWNASPASSVYLSEVAASTTSGLVARLSAHVGGLIMSAVGLGSLPAMWLFVGLNVVTQYMCIRGVYDLIGATDNLTVNVVLTVRKALSVLVSIVAFGNTFTPWHWVGASLVFAGAYVFQTLPNGGQAVTTATTTSIAAGSAPPPLSLSASASSTTSSSSGGDAEKGRARVGTGSSVEDQHATGTSASGAGTDRVASRRHHAATAGDGAAGTASPRLRVATGRGASVDGRKAK